MGGICCTFVLTATEEPDMEISISSSESISTVPIPELLSKGITSGSTAWLLASGKASISISFVFSALNSE